MFCDNCGFKCDDSMDHCPSCGKKLKEKEIAYCRKCGYKIDSSMTRCPICNTQYAPEKKFEKIDETRMSELRDASGFINLKTKWWHHLLIACGGYLLMEVLFSLIGSFIIGYYQGKGTDFSCMVDETCPLETQLLYTKISATTQIISELIIIGIVMLCFMKMLKVFFKEFKDKKTWAWIGFGLIMLYAGNIIYNIFLNLIKFPQADSTNQVGVNEIIRSNPLFGFLFVVIAAPIFEEIIFRFGLFRCFTNKGKKWEIAGIILTTLIFGGVHMIATLQTAFADMNNIDTHLLFVDFVGSFPIYLIGAFALTFTYYMSKNLLASIGAHMAVNAISFFAIISLPQVEECIRQFIQLITRL